MSQQGLDVPAHLSIKTPIDELRSEYSKIDHDRKVRAAIKQQRRMLMGIVSGLEYITTDVVPDCGVELDGWSGSVLSSIDEYDGVFEELYDLYGDRVKVHPVIKLVYMVGASAAMYQLTNTMVKHQKSLNEQNTQRSEPVTQQQGAEYMRDLNRQYMREEQTQKARAEAAANASAGGSFGTLGAAIARDTAKMPLGKGGTGDPTLGSLGEKHFAGPLSRREILQEGQGGGTRIPMTPPPVEVPERNYKMRGPSMMGNPPAAFGLQTRISPADVGDGPDAAPLRPDLTAQAGEIHPVIEGLVQGSLGEAAGLAESECGSEVPRKKGRGRKKKEEDGVTL